MSTLYKTTTLDDTRITYDFRVENLSEGKNWKLFGKPHAAFYHLILATQQEDLQGWLLRQFHYPRLGLASAYSESAKEHLPESKKSQPLPGSIVPWISLRFQGCGRFKKNSSNLICQFWSVLNAIAESGKYGIQPSHYGRLGMAPELQRKPEPNFFC